ncbi:MAG TPA: ABC transporter ATP-binding protein [Mycobacteriales bacterium]|nr:ABC transporter ATP-binding protein [Mycobacteriales bacterium]
MPPTLAPPPPTLTSGITASGVRRTFGDVEAVRGLDLTARPGEITALVGPNGAGKTTLLLVLATLLVPDAGEVRVAGFDPVTQSDEVRARMGWAPDVFGIYDNVTAREYLEFVGAAYRLSKADAARRAGELLEISHLTEFADRQVHVLSRGQKQRLGVSRALVHRPAVLLLDEPAAGLDPRSRVDLRETLIGLAREGTTVLVSSHVLSDLEELADRVVFVDKGVTVGEHRLDALPAAVTARTWRLRALDMTALVAALDRFRIAHDEPGPTGLDVELTSDEAAAELLGKLVRARVAVVSSTPLGGALEAAYLDITTERR